MRLLLLFTILLTSSLFPAETVFSLLPENTRLFIYADLARVLNSPLSHKLTSAQGVPEFTALLDKIKMLAGIDYRRDLDYLLIGAASDQRSRIIAILKGSFDQRGPQALLESSPKVSAREFEGVKVYLLQTGTRGEVTIYIAFPRPGMAVAAFDWLYLCAELEVLAGKRASAAASPLAAKVQLPRNGGIYAMVDEAGAFLNQVSALRSSELITLDLHQQSQAVYATLLLWTDTEQNAAHLFDFSQIIARFIIDKFNLAEGGSNAPIGQQPKAQTLETILARILKRLNIEKSGRQLQASLDCPDEDLVGLLREVAPEISAPGYMLQSGNNLK